MATIRTKLKQLRDADVRYISLVDRAATRIPFRVLKREKESKMGIDLTRVFKSEDTGKPFVSALVVFAQKEDAVAKSIQDAIQTHGFKTDVVQKSDEGETLVYAQGAQAGETQIVRLSDQVLVSVGNLRVPEGWTGEAIEEHGFFPDLEMATKGLHEQMVAVAKSETPQADAEAVLSSYASYLDQMLVLPANCFKLNDAVVELVAKCSCEEKDKAEESEVVTKESEEEKKKRVKDHPPAEMAPEDEEDDQKGPEEAYKHEMMATLTSIESMVTSLASKLETVAGEQAEQKKVLDGVVQKADTLNTTLKATVTAVPVSEDRPGPARMRVAKQDDDPRTGNFDTAFLRRRR